MRLAPFQPEHVFAFEPQWPQKPYLLWMTPEIAELAAGHFSFSGFDERERLIGCAGLAPVDGMGLVAWAVFSSLIEANALGVVRAVRRGLDLHDTVRIEAHVHPEHAKAASFAKRLGFSFECERRDLHPSGSPLCVYVREGR